MSEFSIFIEWNRDTPDFNYQNYTRTFTIKFGSQGMILGSAAPEFHGDPQYIDPEQAFISSLSSCHLLTFLAIASNKGYVVDKYTDKARGEIGKNCYGRNAMTVVLLNPVVVFNGNNYPSEEEFKKLHDSAHNGCIIANSIKGCVDLIIEPVMQHQ